MLQQHYHVFVGDLVNTVDDEQLANAFSKFKSLSDARVMWDFRTGRSRGYGFIAFADKSEAQVVISECNQRMSLGGRVLRLNWATQTSIKDERSKLLARILMAGQQSHQPHNCVIFLGNLVEGTLRMLS